MLYFDVIKAELWPIVVATVVSTVLVLVATGLTDQFLRKRLNRKEDGTAE